MEGWEQSFGISPQAQELVKQLQLAARCESPLLLLGETGTGKSFAARKVHEHSSWGCGPFVHVDLGAIAPTLLHSELFGACRGAYTGADREIAGRLQQASGGSFFLDEIGNVAAEVQAALLVFLDTGRVRPLGSPQEIQVRCRLMAATNRDLTQAVAQGEFRKDLLFRLKGCAVRLPPLRERLEDAVFFAQRFLAESSGTALALSPEAREAILAHSWPGNLRELKHRIALAQTRRQLGWVVPEDMGLPATDHGLGLQQSVAAQQTLVGRVLAGEATLPGLLAELEQKAITEALVRTRGKLREAARLLGVPESSLRSKLKTAKKAS